MTTGNAGNARLPLTRAGLRDALAALARDPTGDVITRDEVLDIIDEFVRRTRPTELEGEVAQLRAELAAAQSAATDVQHYRTLWEDCRRALEKLVNDRDQLLTELEQLRERTAPVPMLLWCPGCGHRHIDEGEFASKSHHTHACQHCGHVWRPAVPATVGVRFLPGFKNGTGDSALTRDSVKRD